MRRILSLLLPITPLLAGSGVPPGSAVAAPLLREGLVGSLNWSGYIDSGPRGSIEGVQGSWIVQRVRPEPNPTYSSQWVGVDGVSTASLVQTGTASDSVGGIPVYQAWIDLLPAPAARLPMTVRPGDVMAATVVKGRSDLWTITLTDVTLHEHYSKTVRYKTAGTSAEWIDERPVLDYGPVRFLANFSYFRVAEFGREYTGSLADNVYLRSCVGWPTQPTLRSVDMVLVPGPTEVVGLDRVSALMPDGASFAVIRTRPFADREVRGASAGRTPQRLGTLLR